jgi:xanthine dehydrogenase molybdenum-binding subunit
MAAECMGRQAHFQEIEVDPETGQVEVTKIVTAQDLGQVISPETCDGQNYGGHIMGYGRAYTDREFFDPTTGVMLNDNLYAYPVPTILDCTLDIESTYIENHLGVSPYGAYGIAESASAIGANMSQIAVYSAIGKWIDDLPITPDKILKALGKI